MEVSIHDFLKGTGLQEEYEAAQESDCQNMSFKPPNSPWIDVEATAFNFVEHISKLSYDLQCRIVAELASRVPEEGDRLLIIEIDGSRKRRNARVIRMKGPSDRISLLITR